MKTVKKLSFVILCFFFLSSCDDELTILDVNTSFTKEITLSIPASGEITMPYSINFSENTDLDDYLNHIENVKINSIKYKVISFTGTSDTVGGEVSLASEGEIFGPYTHNSFVNDIQSQTTFPINDVDKLTILANKLKNAKQLDINVTGSTNATEMSTLILKIDFDLTVAVQAL
ncbi:MAG: hypothetical protein V3U80_02845 [Flavobacteriaceae bacterium]